MEKISFQKVKRHLCAGWGARGIRKGVFVAVARGCGASLDGTLRVGVGKVLNRPQSLEDFAQLARAQRLRRIGNRRPFGLPKTI
jgi:hypothetical protein